MPAEPTASDFPPVLYYVHAAAAIERMQKAFGACCRFDRAGEFPDAPPAR